MPYDRLGITEFRNERKQSAFGRRMLILLSLILLVTDGCRQKFIIKIKQNTHSYVKKPGRR
ncbi:hypothetical protein GCM10008983_18250 [Lentibacillus halophilus]|uniref:Uncharacterized protein n=1 Tax=Lentibacillus halophilus TaxID=295065 RepID=A0ABN0ZAE8_9BACI